MTRNLLALDLLADTDKWVGAVCQDKDPEIWFDLQRIDEAVATCKTCPLIKQCAKYAIDNNILYGVWGGLTETQRQKTKKLLGLSKEGK